MTEEQLQRVQAAGFTVRKWAGRETRYYLKYDGREAGYLLDSDDGSTGSCRHVTVRAGSVAKALRGSF